MDDFTTDKLYNIYFTVDAFLLDEEDGRTLLSALSKIFGADNVPKGLYSRRPLLEKIKGVSDFYLYERLKQLNDIRGFGGGFPTDDDGEIAAKGHALMAIKEAKIQTPHEDGEAQALLSLAQAANEGSVLAMWTYGFMLCAGLRYEKDVEKGIRNLEKAARWNSVEAAVILLRYAEKDRPRYVGMLKTALDATPYYRVGEAFAGYYGVEAKEDKLAKLMTKLFSEGHAKAGVYDFTIARIINSNVLSEKEKKAVLLSGNGDLLNAAASLPLNIEGWEGYSPDVADLPFEQSKESEIISTALKRACVRMEGKKKPLAICSGERYVAEAYIAAIKKAFVGCSVSAIDMAELAPVDLKPSREHAVLRAIKEKSRNVILFLFVGDIRREEYEAVRCFLKMSARSEFKTDCGAALDLSDVLPIVLCDEANAEYLKKDCYVVSLPKLSLDDRKNVVVKEIAEYKAAYSIQNLAVEEKAMDRILQYDVDGAVQIVGKMLAAISDNCKTITEAAVDEAISDVVGKKTKIGFGSENHA